MKRGAIRLLCAFAIASASATSASAFWRIWQKAEAERKSQPVAVAVPLRAVRESGCGRADAVDVFGETAFMRRELDRRMLPEPVTRAIAAAYMAETIETSHTILAPHLIASDALTREASRISYGFIVLRRRGLQIGDDASRILQYLQEPMLSPLEADRQYLVGVLALAASDWPRVSASAHAAIVVSPKYYNAHVLYSLSQLQGIEARDLAAPRCASTLDRIADLLLPLVKLGACPMHVANFDLAADRYLPTPPGPTGDKLRRIRRVYLAYVSKNDRVGLNILADYQKTYGTDGCIARLKGLDFNSRVEPGRP